MTDKKRNDIQVRFPTGSTSKEELVKLAEKNHISLNALMVNIVGWFLDDIKGGQEYKLKTK